MRLRMRVVKIPTMGERLEEWNREKGLKPVSSDPLEAEHDISRSREDKAKPALRRPW